MRLDCPTDLSKFHGVFVYANRRKERKGAGKGTDVALVARGVGIVSENELRPRKKGTEAPVHWRSS